MKNNLMICIFSIFFANLSLYGMENQYKIKSELVPVNQSQLNIKLPELPKITDEIRNITQEQMNDYKSKISIFDITKKLFLNFMQNQSNELKKDLEEKKINFEKIAIPEVLTEKLNISKNNI